MTAETTTWVEANQRHLSAELARVRALLERHLRREQAEAGSAPELPDESGGPYALERLCRSFGLSAFERDTLLLCAGVELDTSFAALCAEAQGDAARPGPSFSLALALLPDPHWSALAPDAPLRRWRLVELSQAAGAPLTTSPLRIDERVLHFLAGVQHLDERLLGLVELSPAAGELVPSHQALAEQIAQVWSEVQTFPVIQLCGPAGVGRREVAAAGCAAVGLSLLVLDGDYLPANAAELEGLARLCEREAILIGAAIYLDTTAMDQSDKRATGALTRLAERLLCPVLLGARERWPMARRRSLALDVRKPTADEQLALWRAELGPAHARLNGRVEGLVAQFNLSGRAIGAAAAQAGSEGADDDLLARELWDASRAQARARLDDLAQRLELRSGWDELILPEHERQLLHEIAAQVGQRSTVYGRWGFGAFSSRGLGISALFAGPSGTGKTLAAEVLAGALRLDLYRIDLSGVVSKYIGETEKNLRRVFDAAEDGGAILFFDEADALFGKRSEVKDSHDRYANIEINYLLQRMEQYRGLAVLATNAKGTLDNAFLRRIRYVVNFPFPDAAQRVEIWRRSFPPQAPQEGLDLAKLARLNIAGGNIRNIALNAAFLAAGAGEPLRMAHLLRAARQEYEKLERPLSESEVAGWVER
jgi:hypothetical protein